MTRSSTSLNDNGLAGGLGLGALLTVAESGAAGGAAGLESCEKVGKTEANSRKKKNKSEPNREIRIRTFWEYVMPTEK